MRIENSPNQNSSNTFQKKKKKRKKENKPHEQNSLGFNNLNQVHANPENNNPSNTPSHSIFIDISGSVILLNRLLDAAEHQYSPLPFYFPNTAIRNTQRASSIAKSIQQKAMQQGSSLNYDMILDLVLSHSIELRNKTRRSVPTDLLQEYLRTPFRGEEADFFEKFHHKSIEQKVNPEIILTLILEYSKQLKIKIVKYENTTKQVQQLRWIIKNSVNKDISSNKQLLLSIVTAV